MNCDLSRFCSPTYSFPIFLLVASCGGGSGAPIETETRARIGTTVAGTNSAPTISGLPVTSVKVGDYYSFTPSASDANGDPLIFSVMNKPRWATFDEVTGSLTGALKPGDSGSYRDISISVSDGVFSSALNPFDVIVAQSASGSAVLSWTPPTKNEDGSNLENLAGYFIYFGTKRGKYPNKIRVNNPGVTTYVVENLSPNTYYFVSTAYNSNGIESEESNIASKTIR